MEIQAGAEFDATPINCTKTLTALKGQKYALVLLKEYYFEDATLAGYCNAPGDPGACISSVDVSLSGGTSSAQISSTSTATSKSGGDWTEEVIAPGVSLWTRYVFKFLDVSACALASDCELTLQFQTVRSTVRNFQGFELHVDAGWVFTLENTQWNYLPEDSTDGTNAGSPPSGPPPVSAKPEGPGRKLHSTCADCPDGKKASYFAFISTSYGTVDPSVLAAPITFELSLPNGVSGYRPGSSSNFGTQTVSDPDYKFLAAENSEFNPPTSNGQSITTKGAVDSASVTVTSFDFGGVALLRAKAQIGGTWVYASAGPQYDQFGTYISPPSCAVAISDTRGFVQIPIDTDCNWIADSWEYEPAMRALQAYHFPKYWDEETGDPQKRPSVLTSKKGDGFGAYDEYRGFHVLDRDDNNKILHRRTKAGSDLDLFICDDTPDSRYHAAVEALIAVRLDGIVRFHAVDPSQGNINNSGRATKVLNNKTEDPNNKEVFAIAFTEEHDAPGSLPGAPIYTQTCEDGTLANAQQVKVTNLPIIFCVDSIARGKADAALDSSSDPLIRAQIAAHELGHRLTLEHYIRQESYSGVDNPSAVGGTAIGTYSLDNTNARQFYTWQPYVITNGSQSLTDSIWWQVGLLALRVVDPVWQNGQSQLPFQSGSGTDTTTYIMWRYLADQPFLALPSAQQPLYLIKYPYTRFIMNKSFTFAPSRLALNNWDFSRGGGTLFTKNDFALISLTTK